MLTMSKFMQLGFSLEEVVQAVTIRAAQRIGLTEQGTLKSGTRADLTIFRIVEEPTTLTDSEGVSILADRVLQPKMTIKDGRVV
jgi:dihydroorotase